MIREVVIFDNSDSVADTLRDGLITHLFEMISILVVLTIIVFFAMQEGTSPLRSLSKSIQEIVGYGDLNIRLPHKGPTEIQDLSRGINKTLERLSNSTRSIDELNIATEKQQILLDNMQTQVWYHADQHSYGVVNKAHASFMGVKKQISNSRICMSSTPKTLPTHSARKPHTSSLVIGVSAKNDS